MEFNHSNMRQMLNQFDQSRGYKPTVQVPVTEDTAAAKIEQFNYLESEINRKTVIFRALNRDLHELTSDLQALCESLNDGHLFTEDDGYQLCVNCGLVNDADPEDYDNASDLGAL